ncbi:hypothetical protein V2G26_015581 [Clonostachys chloroleuca]
MRISALVFALLPASMAAECTRNCGCAGCGVVSSVSFVQSGSKWTATAPNWGTAVLNDDDNTITVTNTGSKWASFNLYGASCITLEAGDTCTSTRLSSEVPSRGLMIVANF